MNDEIYLMYSIFLGHDGRINNPPYPEIEDGENISRDFGWHYGNWNQEARDMIKYMLSTYGMREKYYEDLTKELADSMQEKTK